MRGRYVSAISRARTAPPLAANEAPCSRASAHDPCRAAAIGCGRDDAGLQDGSGARCDNPLQPTAVFSRDVEDNSCSHNERLNSFGRFGNGPNESGHASRTHGTDAELSARCRLGNFIGSASINMSSNLAPSNFALKSVPSDIFAMFQAHLEEIPLKQGVVLHEAGEDITHVFFPIDGVVSLFTVVENSDAVETAVIGREGIVGTLAIAKVPSFSRVTVQIAGKAFRMRAENFLKVYSQSPAFRSLVVRFNAALISQIQQNVACNILHGVKARICRWLLHANDRMDGASLALTQEILAQSISAHRATVIAAYGSLENDGLIRHLRGKI